MENSENSSKQNIITEKLTERLFRFSVRVIKFLAHLPDKPQLQLMQNMKKHKQLLQSLILFTK